MGWKDRGYEPLDVMKPETFKRVQAPPEDVDDPNAEPDPEEERNGWFDFDTDTLDGAKNAVRPASILLWWAAFWRLIASGVALSQGDLGATFAGQADEFTWLRTVDSVVLFAEALIFAVVGAALFFTRSRVAAVLTVLLTLWVLFEKFAILMGWFEGNLLSGLVYLVLLVSATGLAAIAAFNYQHMTARGLDRMPGTENDEENAAKTTEAPEGTST